MKLLLWGISGIIGVIAGFAAIAAPIDSYLNEAVERESAHQYNGQPGFWAGLGGWAVIVFFAAFLGFLAYLLIRFAVKGSAQKIPLTKA